MSLSNHKKAALELSANAIVIIIISIVILGSGIAIFYSMKDKAADKIKEMDEATKKQIQALMLSNNYKVSVYPNTLQLNNGEYESVGLGIQNNYEASYNFYLDDNIANIDIKHYATPESNPTPINNDDKKYLNMDESGDRLIKGNLGAKDVFVKTLLVKMPKDAKKGEYVITLTVQSWENINYGTPAISDYDTVQIFVIND